MPPGLLAGHFEGGVPAPEHIMMSQGDMLCIMDSISRAELCARTAAQLSDATRQALLAQADAMAQANRLMLRLLKKG